MRKLNFEKVKKTLIAYNDILKNTVYTTDLPYISSFVGFIGKPSDFCIGVSLSSGNDGIIYKNMKQFDKLYSQITSDNISETEENHIILITSDDELNTSKYIKFETPNDVISLGNKKVYVLCVSEDLLDWKFF